MENDVLNSWMNSIDPITFLRLFEKIVWLKAIFSLQKCEMQHLVEEIFLTFNINWKMSLNIEHSSQLQVEINDKYHFEIEWYCKISIESAENCLKQLTHVQFVARGQYCPKSATAQRFLQMKLNSTWKISFSVSCI